MPAATVLVIAVASMHIRIVPVIRARHLTTFAFALLLAGNAAAAPAHSPDFLIDLWTSDDDLPDSSVTAIVQTPDRYLWIGTLNGLARFDGMRFIHFDPLNTPELKHARVDRLIVDDQGTLWINTYDGSMTAYRDGVFTHEWQNGEVSAVFSRSNGIYFALLRGELVYGTGSPGAMQWQTVPLIGPTTGNSFRQDASGALWFTTRNGVVGRVEGTQCHAFPADTGLKGTRVTHLDTDPLGRVWVGTEKEIARWTGERFEDQTPTNGPAEVNVAFLSCPTARECWFVTGDGVYRARDRRLIAELDGWRELSGTDATYLNDYTDSKGRVWFRNFRVGLFYADPDDTSRRMTGLPNPRVSCWFEDHEGNIWLGVDRGGLVRLRDKKVHVIGVSQGVQVPAISSVCEDPAGDIWFGTFGGGMYRWRDGDLQVISPAGENGLKSFFSIYPAGAGQLWLSAGNENLHRFDNDRILEMPDPAHGIKALLLDRQGRLWIGRQNGLACWTNNTLVNFSAGGGFERIDVRAIAEDARGVIWFGTGNGRLWEFQQDQFTAHNITDGLGSQAIRSLLPDEDGVIWAGTFRGGLLRFKNGRFTRYTSRQGLPSDVICQILEDTAGRLWVGSHKGIFSVPKSAFSDLDDESIKTLPCVSYGLYDGLPTLECTGNYQPCSWRGRDGRLWFATVKGLVTVDPAAMSVKSVPPPVVIEEIELDGELFAAGSRTRAGAVPLEIPPGRHQLEFRYTALSFTAPDKVRFRYRLAGFDNDWVEADGKRSAHYGPLPPGEYVFEVAARNDDAWSAHTATIALNVLPHYWQTWWFQMLGGAGALGAIFAAVRITVTRRLHKRLEALKQQQAVQRERERIAKDIHDDIGAGLTHILLQSSLAQRDSQGQVRADLGQISETARELVRAMDEIVWAINPENDTLDSLASYMGKFVQDFVTSSGKRCRIIVPPELPGWPVSSEVRHNLFLAIKEALNNAVKHSGASEIAFELNVRPAGVAFVVRDNGRGFEPGGLAADSAGDSRIASGHGMRNMVRRLEDIGGACVIRSAPQQGTVIELTLPLHGRNTQAG